MAVQSTVTLAIVEVDVVADLSTIPDARLGDGFRAWVKDPGLQHGLWALDRSNPGPATPFVVPTLSTVGFWVFVSSGGVGPDADAVIFDDAVVGANSNVRTDRLAAQSPIDNTKAGIVNLGSETDGRAGATGNYATIGGGDQNVASGDYSTVPGGFGNTASGAYSTARGQGSTAIGDNSHAEGSGTTIGDGSHAEGIGTSTGGLGSHAEGLNTTTSALAPAAHVEGTGTSATNDSAHAEGVNTVSAGVGSHAEGNASLAFADASHAEGTSTTGGNFAHAEGLNTNANGFGSHSEGIETVASGGSAHAEGGNTQANGISSHAEGGSTQAVGVTSHAEGNNSVAQGDGSHAEGSVTHADGTDSHSEGVNTVTAGASSHAEGSGCSTTVGGVAAHAEGQDTVASALAAHSKGVDAAATRTGQDAMASGRLAVVGDAQTSLLVFRGQTPGVGAGEAVELRYGPTLEPFVLEDGRGYSVRVSVIAGGVVAAVRTTRTLVRTANVRRDAGLTVVTAVNALETFGDAGAATWTLTIAAAAAPDRLAVTFGTGVTTAATAVCARVEFKEVVYP